MFLFFIFGIYSCSERNSTNPGYNTYGYDSWVNLLITIFAIVVGILIIIVIVLSYFVNKYRRRPRVKKRFVVSKAGITPLTSRPQLPDDHCEIMIENCCNMNICETVNEANIVIIYYIFKFMSKIYSYELI